MHVSLEALRGIASAADAMSVHVARASLHYHDLDQSTWLDNLMMSAKHLDRAILTAPRNDRVLPVGRVGRGESRRAAQPPRRASQSDQLETTRTRSLSNNCLRCACWYP